jgi:hypothetical protein
MLSADMAKPYLAPFGLGEFAETSAQSDARRFVLDWKRLAGSSVADVRENLTKLLDEFFASRPSSLPILDQAVHEAFRHRNLPKELSIWISALCAGGAIPELIVTSDCGRAIAQWCERVIQLKPLIDEIYEVEPSTDWDKWLSSPDGFYGHDVFQAMVMLGTIAHWRVIEDLRDAGRRACSENQRTVLLERAASAVDPAEAEWVSLTL